jgi:hypothetical protein
VDIVWLTNRGSTVLPLAKSLGLPRFPVAAELPIDVDPVKWYDVSTAGREWWKLQVAKNMAGSNRVLIWTDDELFNSPEAADWIYDRPMTLGIEPDSTIGLSPADLDYIEEFVA